MFLGVFPVTGCGRFYSLNRLHQSQSYVAQSQSYVAQMQGHVTQMQGYVTQMQGYVTQMQGYVTQVSDLAFRQFVHMPVVLPASCCSR